MAVKKDMEAVVEKSVEVSDEAIDKLVNRYMNWSLGLGFVPLPLLDFVALTSVQTKMVYELCKLYEVEYSEERVRSIVSSLVGSALPCGLAAPLASLIKFIPGLGTAAGGLAYGLSGAASTYALAAVFVKHFETGKDILSLDSAEVRSAFQKNYEKGQEVAGELQASAE